MEIEAHLAASIDLLRARKYSAARDEISTATCLLKAWTGPRDMRGPFGAAWGRAHYQRGQVAVEQLDTYGFCFLCNGMRKTSDSDEDGLHAEEIDAAGSALEEAERAYTIYHGSGDAPRARDARSNRDHLLRIKQRACEMTFNACTLAARASSKRPTRNRDRWLWTRLKLMRELPAVNAGWRDERYLMAYFVNDEYDAATELLGMPRIDPEASDWKNSIGMLKLYLTGPWVGPLDSSDREQAMNFQDQHNLDGRYPPPEYTFRCLGCGDEVEYGFLCLEYMKVIPGGWPTRPVTMPPGSTLSTFNRIVHRLVCPACCNSVLDASLARSVSRFGEDGVAKCQRWGEGEDASPEEQAKGLALLRDPPWRLARLAEHGHHRSVSLVDAIVRHQHDSPASLEDRIYFTEAKESSKTQVRVNGGSAHVFRDPSSGENFVVQAMQCSYCSHEPGEGQPNLKRCGGCRDSPDCPWYCSTACQRAHWPEHKPVCRARRAIAR